MLIQIHNSSSLQGALCRLSRLPEGKYVTHVDSSNQGEVLAVPLSHLYSPFDITVCTTCIHTVVSRSTVKHLNNINTESIFLFVFSVGKQQIYTSNQPAEQIIILWLLGGLTVKVSINPGLWIKEVMSFVKVEKIRHSRRGNLDKFYDKW